jgi:ABC-2 type transport system permease protein
MIRRIAAIAAKEFRHITRDWQTLMIILLLPVIMMFMFGYALTMDLREVPVLIEAPVQGEEIRYIAASIDATILFKVVGTVAVNVDPAALFKKHHVKAIFRFPPQFAQELKNGRGGAQVQVLIDGSDPNVGTILKNAVESLVLKAALETLHIKQPTIVTLDQRVLYNQEQRSALYFVPGLMAIILLMISALLTSLAITREKEIGTLEQLLVSPLRPGEIVLGKILPYLALAGVDGALILLVGYAAFGVRVAGSLAFLAAASTVYIFTALAIGLLVSTIAKKQQHAMLIVLPATLLPTIILSGFIFPLASLPLFLRCISAIVPATYFLQIIRGVILKGVGIGVLWQPLAVLGGMSLLLIVVSVKKFRVRL